MAVAAADAAVIGIRRAWNADAFGGGTVSPVVPRVGIGSTNVDLAAATAAGVVICNTPEAPSVSTAEHAVTLMLAITKDVPRQQRRAHSGATGPDARLGLELAGTTLGLVGCGRIAAASRQPGRRSACR